MAKAIKRVGVIFLAVAIICLMAIGVLLGATSAKKENANLLGSSNKIENVSETSEVEIPPISEEVLLDGTTCAEQAAKWNEAIEKSLANGGDNHILVTMMNDWIAPNTDNHYFGVGTGFSSGRIELVTNTIITLDLNGHMINRALQTNIGDGAVIMLDGGILNLKDSCYDSAKIYNAYKNDPTTDLVELGKSLGFGRISGGYAGTGGGFWSGTTGTLNVYSGMICENKSNNGAGIGFYGTNQINIYDGLIAKNSASNIGAGIMVRNNVELNIYGGFVSHNKIINGATTSNDGGGIYAKDATTTVNIQNGIISNNFAYNDGGGICTDSGATLNISGGFIEYNEARGSTDSAGGGICILGTSTANIENCYIRNNISGCLGGGIHNTTSSSITLRNTIVSDNISYTDNSNYAGGGIAPWGEIKVGAGVQVFNNFQMEEGTKVKSNIHVRSETNKIEIIEYLISEGKTTYIGVTSTIGYSSGIGYYPIYTKNYSATGNSSWIAVVQSMFFSDVGNRVSMSNGEVREENVSAGKTTTLNWRYGSEAIETTTAANITLPYREEGYIISNGQGTDIRYYSPSETNTDAETHSIIKPGVHSFISYSTQNVVNPVFMVTIEEPKQEIVKPTIKHYGMYYNGELQTFYPDGFDSTTMEIAYNRIKEIGTYKAKVRLKDIWNYVWADTKNIDSIEIEFEIIESGLQAKTSAGYNYVYIKDNYRRTYTEDKLKHLVDDLSFERYVLGNIPQNTNIESFINNLENDKTLLKIYNNKGEKVFNGVLNDANKNILIATGFKVELYENSTATQPYDEVYLSILGDVVADGVINTLDATCINRIARGEIKLETLNIEQQLAAMVDNKGKVTSTDGKILLNVIGGNTQTDSYFESNANITNDYMLWDLSIDSVTGKTYRVGTELTATSLANNAIIGNIAPKTKASDLKTNLASQLGVDIRLIAIYQVNGTVASDNDYIGTGCYINYNGNTANKIYLSVLGDLTGDGVVNTADITYLNRIVNGNVKLNTNDIKDELTILSASIQNKGNLTTADSETLLNYIGGNADMTKYF